MNINRLIHLADALDKKGLVEEADLIDRIAAESLLKGITRIDIQESIKARLERYIPDNLTIQPEFHMTVASGHTKAIQINPDMNLGEIYSIETGKLYIGEKYAVLDVIKSPLKVASGVPHITVALASGARPVDAKNLILGTERPLEVHDMHLSLSGPLNGPETKKTLPQNS